jgi:cytochrome c oxidase cbb3-type subunit 3
MSTGRPNPSAQPNASARSEGALRQPPHLTHAPRVGYARATFHLQNPSSLRLRSFFRRPAPARFLFAALAFVAATGCTRRHGSEEGTSSTPAPERPAASASVSNDPKLARVNEGKALYERYCQLCHAPGGTGYAADNAPSLVSRTFLESASDAFIAHGIRVGRPNTAMGAYGKSRGGPLSDTEIDQLVAYLRSQGPAAKALPSVATNGNPANGAVLFDKNCRACHGSPAARGNALLLENPELLASASTEFLRYAIVHGRPPTPMPAYGGKLLPTEIEDILAWLKSRTPAAPASAPVKNPLVPTDLPVVVNPKGGKPSFTLRDGRFVSAEQVKNALAQKKRMVLVDARSPSDWIQFHIPGAISLAYYDAEQLARIPNDGTWVVAYCACPHHASGEVVDALRRKNYPNTAVLDEGILFWKDRGYPLVGEAVTPAPKNSSR